MAQMSFGLRGGFWLTSLPLFQASRLWMVIMTDSLVVDRSLIVRRMRERHLRGKIFYESFRTGAELESSLNVVVSGADRRPLHLRQILRAAVKCNAVSVHSGVPPQRITCVRNFSTGLSL